MLTKIANICQLIFREVLMATLNISIPDIMRTWINTQIDEGRYANASDYIRDLVRHDQRQYDEIRIALIEGENSGISKRSVIDIIEEETLRLKNG